MDTGLTGRFVLRKLILFLSIFMMTPVVMSDDDSDETKLLKSWGFEFNSKGLLVFTEQQPVVEYSHWKHDSVVTRNVELADNQNKTLEPLVISSKNETTD